ncbi:hypothetical protein Taro_010881 [Colocasia esculenta]|uniref:Uncharacterized protein n=1 Tax=Colocasia esculenta TaxID=4460 RepID=A0A843UAY8_COLES|nr:hypothetical protein [Colocasia esculenta]
MARNQWQAMQETVDGLTQALQNVVQAGNQAAATAKNRAGDLHRNFRSLNPPRFSGSPDPDDAENWQEEIERIFQVMQCTNREKVVQTFLCKRCVDTPINGVDTTTQIQRQNFFRNQSTQVDTLSGQVDTRPSSQNSQFEELGQQVDTLSEQVDTGPSSQNSLFIIWTVCRHHHQGRSTHYGKFVILKWMGATSRPDGQILTVSGKNSSHFSLALILLPSPLHSSISSPNSTLPCTMVRKLGPRRGARSSASSRPIPADSAVAQSERRSKQRNDPAEQPGSSSAPQRAAKRGRPSSSRRGSSPQNPRTEILEESSENPEESSSSSSESQ